MMLIGSLMALFKPKSRVVPRDGDPEELISITKTAGALPATATSSVSVLARHVS